MKKWVAAIVATGLLLVGTTAMAKSEQTNSSDAACGKIPPGLLHALEKAKNPKAKASIEKNIEKHKQKCKVDKDDSKWTDEQRVSADKAALQIGFSGNDSILHVTSPLKLPASGAKGSTITWTSSKPNVISNSGLTVVRPTAADETVIMTATITFKQTTDTKTFTLKVKALNILTDTQKVSADKAALEIDFGGSDSTNRVTRPIDQLPAAGVNGSVITWTSSSPEIVSHDGKTIHRPAQGAGDVTVVMTAFITSNSISDVKVFILTVKQEFTTVEKLAADKADLSISFAGSDSTSHVTKPLSLSATGYYGSTVVWFSSAPSIISNDGKTVTRPAKGTGDATVTLWAYISNNGIVDMKTFEVVVKQLT